MHFPWSLLGVKDDVGSLLGVKDDVGSLHGVKDDVELVEGNEFRDELLVFRSLAFIVGNLTADPVTGCTVAVIIDSSSVCL